MIRFKDADPLKAMDRGVRHCRDPAECARLLFKGSFKGSFKGAEILKRMIRFGLQGVGLQGVRDLEKMIRFKDSDPLKAVSRTLTP